MPLEKEILDSTTAFTSNTEHKSWPSNELHMETGYEIPVGIVTMIVVAGLIYTGKRVKDYFLYKTGW